MNVQITWNGADITTSVTEYVREQDICTGIGTLDLTAEAKTARNFMPWNTIIVYENGTKMGTYNISSAEETVPGGIYVVSCQDDSKKLQEHWIEDLYVIDYPSTARYWIELFLTAAQVSYNFNTTGYGNGLSEDTQLGGISTYDEFIYLLQLCGWYFYFDNENVCQIGKLDVDAEPSVTFTSNQILKIGYVKNDKMLRNRAVVWGAGDTKTGQWIYADTSTYTAWNRPGNDYRTVVYENSAIKTFAIAASLAASILSEFSKTVSEKTIQVIDSHSEVTLGTFIRGITPQLTEDGMVAHFTVNMSSAGFTSTYTLDKRCPRLFGYVNWSDYVYIGTQGSGVWRKWITGNTWSNYSTGITNLNIKDLSAYEGMLGLVTDNGQAYIRHNSQGAWSRYTPSSFINSFPASGQPTIITSGILAEASSLDRTYGVNGAITVGFTAPNPNSTLPSGMPSYLFPASGNLSWVQSVALGGYPIYTQQIVVASGITASGTVFPLTDFGVVDLETNWDGINLISVYGGKRTEIEYLITSGVPGAEYGGYTAGFNNYWRGYPYGDGVQVDPGITCYMPPVTSGIWVEVSELGDEYVPSGIYHIESVSLSYHYGNYCIGQNPDTGTGVVTGFLNSQIQVIELAYYAYYDYTWGDPPDFYEGVGYYKSYNFETYPFADGANVVYFYKIDDTHYSALYDDFYDFNPILKIFHINYTTELVEVPYGGNGVAEVIATYEYPLDNCQGGYYATGGGRDYSPTRMSRSIAGGKYYTIFYASAKNGAYPLTTLLLLVINMETGTSTTTEIPTAGDYERSLMVYSVGNSPNYIYQGVTDFGRPRYNEDMTKYTFTCVPILIDTHTGEVKYTEVEVESPDCPDTIQDVYMDEHNIWQDDGSVSPYIRDPDYIEYRQRGTGYFSVSEDINSGAGYGIFTAMANILENVPDNWDATKYHEMTAVIKISTDMSVLDLTNYENIWWEDYWSDYHYWIQHETPLWLMGGYQATDWGLTDFVPLYSNHGTTGLMFCGKLRKSIYDLTYYEGVLLNSNFGGMVELQHPPLGGSTITNVTKLMDDEDNSIYICRGNQYDEYIFGYRTDGSISKILFGEYYYDEYAYYDEETDTYSGEVYFYPLNEKSEIVQNKIVYSNYEDSYGYTYTTFTCFYNPAATGISTTDYNRYMVLKHDPKVLPSGLFTIIIEGEGPFYVDASKSIPTVVYAKPYNDDEPSAYVGRSFTNEYGSFTLISPGGGMGVHDVREFDLYDEFGLFPASGVASGILDRYIGVAGGHLGAVMFNSGLTNNGGMYVPYAVIASGNFTHLDFTNNDPDPYIFVSTSGISTSGRFFQRDKETSLWHDCSSTLPSGVITIIRADDRM